MTEQLSGGIWFTSLHEICVLKENFTFVGICENLKILLKGNSLL